jgi:CRISPR/Cas system-associated protein Csx1
MVRSVPSRRINLATHRRVMGDAYAMHMKTVFLRRVVFIARYSSAVSEHELKRKATSTRPRPIIVSDCSKDVRVFWLLAINTLH